MQLNGVGAWNKRTAARQFPDGVGLISMDPLLGTTCGRLLDHGLVWFVGPGVGWLHHLGASDGPIGPSPRPANPLTDRANRANQPTRAPTWDRGRLCLRAPDQAESRLTEPMEFTRGAPDRVDTRPTKLVDPTCTRPTRISHFLFA
jgi:hypothetical protein